MRVAEVLAGDRIDLCTCGVSGGRYGARGEGRTLSSTGISQTSHILRGWRVCGCSEVDLRKGGTPDRKLKGGLHDTARLAGIQDAEGDTVRACVCS